MCVCLYVMSGKLCLDFASFFFCLGKCGCPYVCFIEGVFLCVFFISFALVTRKIFGTFFFTLFYFALH